jgi:hypothetical protein
MKPLVPRETKLTQAIQQAKAGGFVRRPQRPTRRNFENRSQKTIKAKITLPKLR